MVNNSSFNKISNTKFECIIDGLKLKTFDKLGLVFDESTSTTLFLDDAVALVDINRKMADDGSVFMKDIVLFDISELDQSEMDQIWDDDDDEEYFGKVIYKNFKNGTECRVKVITY